MFTLTFAEKQDDLYGAKLMTSPGAGGGELRELGEQLSVVFHLLTHFYGLTIETIEGFLNLVTHLLNWCELENIYSPL